MIRHYIRRPASKYASAPCEWLGKGEFFVIDKANARSFDEPPTETAKAFGAEVFSEDEPAPVVPFSADARATHRWTCSRADGALFCGECKVSLSNARADNPCPQPAKVEGPRYERGRRYRGTFECEGSDPRKFVPIGTPRLVLRRPSQTEMWEWAELRFVQVGAHGMPLPRKFQAVLGGMTGFGHTKIQALRALRRALEKREREAGK